MSFRGYRRSCLLIHAWKQYKYRRGAFSAFATNLTATVNVSHFICIVTIDKSQFNPISSFDSKHNEFRCMGTPRLPRPVMPNPALQRAVEDDLRPDAETLRNALLDAGLDPDTIPAAAARTQQNQRSIADILEDEIIAEVLADDLSNKEASLVAGAMWTGVHHKNVERARSVWRVVTFLLKFPAAAADDIPPRLLTDTFFASYRKPRATMSSLIHHWSKTNLFSMARDRLNSFPLTRWSQHRRNQMDVICQWESEICERAETRRKDRLVKKLKPKGLKS